MICTPRITFVTAVQDKASRIALGVTAVVTTVLIVMVQVVDGKFVTAIMGLSICLMEPNRYVITVKVKAENGIHVLIHCAAEVW